MSTRTFLILTSVEMTVFFTIRAEDERHQVQNFSYNAAGYVIRCPQEGCVANVGDG